MVTRVLQTLGNPVSLVAFLIDLGIDLIPLPFIPRSRRYVPTSSDEVDIVELLGGVDVLRLNISPLMLQQTKFRGTQTVKFIYKDSKGWVRMFNGQTKLDSDGDQAFGFKSLSLWHETRRKAFYARVALSPNVRSAFQEVADIQLIF